MVMTMARVPFSTDNSKQPNIYTSYSQLSQEEKQAAARQRRNQRLGRTEEPSVGLSEFNANVETTLDKLEAAFEVLKDENSFGMLKVKRGKDSLEVEV